MSVPPARLGVRRFHWSTVWGIGGYLLLLSQAVYRLAQRAWEPIAGDQLAGWHWPVMLAFVGFMAYSEGYKGFFLQVGPRVAARGVHLASDPSWVRRLLAPLFCMSLFGATKKRLIISWCLYTGIIILVLAVRQLRQPYRGMVDAGVVVGLAMGIVAVIGYTVVALRGGTLPVPSDVPEGDENREQEGSRTAA